MTSHQYTTKSSKSGKRGVQNTQTLVLPSAERPFITDLKAATRMAIAFQTVYSLIYYHVLGASMPQLMAEYDLDFTDPDAWQQIRPLLAQRNTMGYQFVCMAEEHARLRIVYRPVTTLQGIYEQITASALYIGANAAQIMSTVHVDLVTGEYMGEDE